MTDSGGNGYGVALDYANDLLILQKRTAWTTTTLATHTVIPSLTTWYTLRLIKVASNLTIEIHAGKTVDFSSPLAYAESVDSTYTSFAQENVNGGYPYYTDNPTVRKLL
jgi:hypothetical protein